MKKATTPANVTQKDVAKALGLSQATVSLALRGDKKIPLERQKHIKAFAKKMGYRPSSAASALAHLRHSSKSAIRGEVLGWINFWEDPSRFHQLEEFHQYFLGAQATAEKLGYSLREFTHSGNITPKRLESILIARGISGILLPPHPKGFDFADFNWSKFSFVKFGHSISSPSGHTVSPDQTYNSILAIERIREKGYRRIGFVEGDYPYLLFDAGYLKAQRAIPSKDRLPILKLSNTQLSRAKHDLQAWITQKRPDAILTSSGLVPGMLKDLGYRIPEDMGIAATSVRDGKVDSGIDQNPYEIGRVGVLSLISLLHDTDRGIPDSYREIMVKGLWVDGSSLPPRT